MARPRKPVEILKANGSYQESKHGHRALPIPSSGDPAQPPGMTDAAKVVWEQIVPQLTEMGVLHKQDSHAVAALCELQAQHSANCRRLARNRSDTANQRAWRDSHALLQRTLNDFGLTPLGRSRLGTPIEKPEPESAFDALKVV